MSSVITIMNSTKYQLLKMVASSLRPVKKMKQRLKIKDNQNDSVLPLQ